MTYSLAFECSRVDNYLFIKVEYDTRLYVLVYANDIIITGNNKLRLNHFSQLDAEFSLKDLRKLNYFLKVLNQKKYIMEFLSQTDMLNCSPYPTHLVIFRLLTS